MQLHIIMYMYIIQLFKENAKNSITIHVDRYIHIIIGVRYEIKIKILKHRATVHTSL